MLTCRWTQHPQIIKDLGECRLQYCVNKIGLPVMKIEGWDRDHADYGNGDDEAGGDGSGLITMHTLGFA